MAYRNNRPVCEECGEYIKFRGQRCWETGGQCFSEADASPAPRAQSGSGQTVTYKDKKYRLMWKGSTKYGMRAHLQFLDGTKDFWVDASLVRGA